MMLGEKELVKLFPNFKDLVQPSGIDLELDRIYTQESRHRPGAGQDLYSGK